MSSRYTPVLLGQAPPNWSPKERSCDGKKRYATAALALKIAARLHESRKWRMDVYRCRYCGALHLTHRDWHTTRRLEREARITAARGTAPSPP